MTTSATKNCTVKPLLKAYRKPLKKVSLRDPLTNISIERPNMSPVLYHGTVRYVVKQWQKEGIRNHGLSVISDALIAAGFSRYRMGDSNSMTADSIFLENRVSRKLFIGRRSAKEMGLLDEYESMCSGQVVNSLVMFDRDQFLESAYKAHQNGFCCLYDEVDGSDVYPGVRIKWNHGLPDSIRYIPFSTIIATLDLHQISLEAEIRVFSHKLWKKNFKLSVSSLEHLLKKWPLGARQDMMDLTSLVFLGKETA